MTEPSDRQPSARPSRLPAKPWLLLIVALLVWSYFARPIYDFLWIAAGRAADAVGARLGPSYFREQRKEVVDRALHQGDQIAAYLNAQRKAAAQDEQLAALDFSSAEAYVRSTEPVRARLRKSLRYPPPGFEPRIAAPVKDTLLGEDEVAVYRELQIPVLPGVDSTGIYVRPKSAAATARLPLVIAAVGRGGMPAPTADGKAPGLQRSTRDMAWHALQRGYAVWLPTFVYYGRDGDDLRDRLTLRAWEVGTSLPAIEIAKVVRAIDAFAQRPDIDARRIAMVGHSYGGFYTFYTTALDPRIRVAVVSAYFNDREAVLDAAEPHGLLDWRFPGSLALWRDPAVAALVAPRPLLIEAGSQDQLFPIAGARSAAPKAAHFYEQLGMADRFRFLEFAGRHDFEGDEALKFVELHLPRVNAPERGARSRGREVAGRIRSHERSVRLPHHEEMAGPASRAASALLAADAQRRQGLDHARGDRPALRAASRELREPTTRCRRSSSRSVPTTRSRPSSIPTARAASRCRCSSPARS